MKNEKYFSSSLSAIPGGRLEIVGGRDEVRLDGCGCFLLFQRQCKGGQAYLLNRPGLHHYNLNTIGSVYQEVRLQASRRIYLPIEKLHDKTKVLSTYFEGL